MQLAIQAKNSQEVPCRKKISVQLKTHPSICETENKESCDKKDRITSSQVKKINKICDSEDSLLKLSCKTENLLNIPVNSFERKADPSKTENASDFKTRLSLPTKSFQRVESGQTSGNSQCSSVSLTTSKVLKTSNDTQQKWKICLSNSFASGESTNKMTPNDASETMKPQITISTNLGENSDLVHCSKRIINEERLAVPLLQESPYIEEQSKFKHNQLEIDNVLKNSNENAFDSNHISKSDEELVSSEVLCCKDNISHECQEVSNGSQIGDDCIKNPALLNQKEADSDTNSLQIINSSVSLFNSDKKTSSQSLQCCPLNQCSENQPIKIMGSLPSDYNTKSSDAKENQNEILDNLVKKQFQKDPFSVCDFQTICDLKLTRTEKVIIFP